MTEGVVCGMATMNSGLGIPGSTIRWFLENQLVFFKKVVVVDGALTSEAKEYYSKFDNVQVIDSPWADNYVVQYKKFAEILDEGQWALWLDDDEICSKSLLRFLFPTGTDKLLVEYKNDDIVKLPCVLHLSEDGKNYYAAEPDPEPLKSTGRLPWTKNILFKKNDGLFFDFFGSHVIPHNKSGKYNYVDKPYFHMKSLESFVYNDVWQAFLHPQGQQYTDLETQEFKMFTQCYNSTKEFKEATKKGTWSPPMKKFAWDNRKEYSRPISRLAWVYFILEGHLMPEVDSFMDWSVVKNYVLSESSMKIFNTNKKNDNKVFVG